MVAPVLTDTLDAPLTGSEQHFRLLVDSVKDYAIFLLDPRGIVSSWNIGAERIKGYLADEIIGQHFSRFYPEADVLSGKCEMELTEATRVGRFEDEGWRLRKDGTAFWANVVITALRDVSGHLVGFAKVTRDLSERRAAEEARLALGRVARERIHALSELSEALVSARTVTDVARAVADAGLAFANANVITLHLLDDEDGSLRLIAERGCEPEERELLERLTAGSEHPAYGIGVGRAAAVWIEDTEEQADAVPSPALLPVATARVRATWCAPLVAEGRTMGMISVGFHDPRRFSQDEREFVATFTRQSAQALVRAQRLDAERAAATLAERLRASLDATLRSIADAVIATDSHGAITLMNGLAETITGWPEPEATGKQLAEVLPLVHESTSRPALDTVERVVATGNVVSLGRGVTLTGRSGARRHVEISGAPIRSAGEIRGVILVFRDVTKRHEEERRQLFLAEAIAALSESLENEENVARVAELAVPAVADFCVLDLVAEGASQATRLAIASADPSGVALARQLFTRNPPRPDATSGAEKVLRTGRSEIYPELTEQLLTRIGNAEQREIATGLGLSSVMIVPLINRNHVFGALSFMFSESSRRYGPADLAMAEDLGRRCAIAIENARLYRSEQKAHQTANFANRAKDEFLAVVSHELRTPLNAIMGWAKLLTMQNFQPAERQRAIDTIERNSVHMAKLIEDLLDMSRVISGKMRLEVQPVNAHRVIESVLESLEPAAAAKNVALRRALDATNSALMADPARLQQIVWNLLSNAVKFSANGGQVDVHTRLEDGHLEIAISDNGRGIEPSFLPHIFEPFRQEDASPTRSRGGLGLGLAITRQLVEMHGGKVSAHSEGPGKGATFVASLPSVVKSRPVGDQPDAPSPKFERPEHLRGLRVLVVDDEPDARRLIATILRECGCEVTTAGSVQEALTSFRENPPEVLLSDVAMPGEDGYALIRLVRALSPGGGGDIPAAAITAYASAEDRRQLLNAGFSIHLPKPIHPAEVVAVTATLSRFIHRGSATH